MLTYTNSTDKSNCHGQTDVARGIRAIYAFFHKRPASAPVARAVPAAPAELHIKSLELDAVARQDPWGSP